MTGPGGEDLATLREKVAAVRDTLADRHQYGYLASMPIKVAGEGGLSFVPARLHRMNCPLSPPDDRPMREFDDEAAAVAWLYTTLEQDWERCSLCMDPGESRSHSSDDERLVELLRKASDADPMTRIEYRDPIAQFGARAVESISAWLVDPRLARFAVRVIEHAVPIAGEDAIAALREASACAGPASDDARDALRRVGGTVSPWPRVAVDVGTVAFLGDGPFQESDLSVLCPDLRLVHPHGDGTFLDWIVVGHSATANDLRHLKLQVPRPARFLPQEAWIDFVVFGHDWWLDEPERLNAVVDGHPALAAIRDGWPVMWRWPGIEPSGIGEPGDAELDHESDLHRLGYQITDMTRNERWTVLTVAVEQRLGLHAVATTIAGLVKLRKLQRGGRVRFRHAIEEWEFDLAKLKATYYTGRSGFPWPGTEPD